MATWKGGGGGGAEGSGGGDDGGDVGGGECRRGTLAYISSVPVEYFLILNLLSQLESNPGS